MNCIALSHVPPNKKGCPLCTRLLVAIPYGPSSDILNSCSIDAHFFILRTFFAKPQNDPFKKRIIDINPFTQAILGVLERLLRNEFKGSFLTYH